MEVFYHHVMLSRLQFAFTTSRQPVPLHSPPR